jgi:hypothetical protein
MKELANHRPEVATNASPEQSAISYAETSCVET